MTNSLPVSVIGGTVFLSKPRGLLFRNLHRDNQYIDAANSGSWKGRPRSSHKI